MTGGASLLERFRRTAGVPEAVGEDPANELIPVFAALDEIEREADRLRQRARERAERTLSLADAEAEQIRARWRRRADAERIRSETERRRAALEEAHSTEEAAQAAAARLRERGLARVPTAVERVMADILETRNGHGRQLDRG